MLPTASRPATAALATHAPRSCSWQLARHFQRSAVIAMARPWRPDMNDVDRLSKGDAAKIRGTGNFNIPHRLNADERPVYEAAKKKGFLQVRGTGYRKGRKGNPLPNIWRQWCDAKGWPCVVIEQDMSGGSDDVVVVDLAPLRMTSLDQAVQLCYSTAQAAGAAAIPPSQRPLDAVPFNTLPLALPQSVLQMLYSEQAPAAPTSSSSGGGMELSLLTPEQIAAAELAVVQQGDVIRQLKARGNSNATPEVQQEVQELLRLKQQLQRLLDRAALLEQAAADAASSRDVSSSSSNNASESNRSDGSLSAKAKSSSRGLDEDHPFANAAIWQIPAMPLFFAAQRPVAKEFAKQLGATLATAVVVSA